MVVFKTQATIQVASVYRETPGDFGPSVVGDLPNIGHVQAGQVLVHLQDIDRKSMVSGGCQLGSKRIKRVTVAASGWRFSACKGHKGTEALPPRLLRGLLRQHRV